jgi:hypothetical protein
MASNQVTKRFPLPVPTSAHGNDAKAFRAALEVLMSRRDPSAPYQLTPLILAILRVKYKLS